jgi:hypothetical protein
VVLGTLEGILVAVVVSMLDIIFQAYLFSVHRIIGIAYMVGQVGELMA